MYTKATLRQAPLAPLSSKIKDDSVMSQATYEDHQNVLMGGMIEEAQTYMKRILDYGKKQISDEGKSCKKEERRRNYNHSREQLAETSQ
ncbi:hypothetical protein VNO78_32828 [Psophocarpus tetragonolobus]|uniref:Uncharacterized protein n=1 Tax=Psophocarpus tetragonolobus TaxID=3891 RepID=A0AAN9NXA3_PSOTE